MTGFFADELFFHSSFKIEHDLRAQPAKVHKHHFPQQSDFEEGLSLRRADAAHVQSVKLTDSNRKDQRAAKR